MQRSSLIAALACTFLAGAQIIAQGTPHGAPSDPVHFHPDFYPVESKPPTIEGPVVNAPFEALLTLTVSMKSAGKDSRAEVETTTRSRDSAGRVRDQAMQETPRVLGGTGQGYQVHVQDPVSHCNISWEEPRPTDGPAAAMFLCLPSVVLYTAPPGPPWDPAKVPDDTHTESTEEHVRVLPDQVIEGVSTFGIGTETTTQAHDQQHANHSTTEMRFSPELRELMLLDQSSSDDTGAGMHTRAVVTNVRRIEPAASVFFPPSGYDLVDGRSKASH